MRVSKNTVAALVLLACGLIVGGCARDAGSGTGHDSSSVKLLNVSYDPTRELYEDYNRAFAAYWKTKTGQTVTIAQSHGGSGKQSQAVINGLPADVVTLGIPYDIDAIAKSGAIHKNWAQQFPQGSTPYTSTVVLLVRKGNPKHIRDWADLARPDVQVITPNPKTSSGGRWNYVAALGYALKVNGNNLVAATGYLSLLYKNVPVLDAGARGATNTFAERGIGDVLIAWENEALLATEKLGPDKFEIVVPSISVLAEPPVAIVDENVDRKGTRAVAQAYLQYLYSPTGQAIAARNFYRPRYPASVAAADLKRFPPMNLFTVQSLFGSWERVQNDHFKSGAIFDQIYHAHKS